MNIFFDVDYTLIGGMDGAPRPLVREVLERLKGDGHDIYIWSGVGLRWKEVNQLGITHVVSDCFVKPMSNYYQAMKAMSLPVEPEIVVDDFPVVASAFGGVSIPAYNFENLDDRVMERVYEVISEYSSTGHSTDPIFRPKK